MPERKQTVQEHKTKKLKNTDSNRPILAQLVRAMSSTLEGAANGTEQKYLPPQAQASQPLASHAVPDLTKPEFCVDEALDFFITNVKTAILAGKLAPVSQRTLVKYDKEHEVNIVTDKAIRDLVNEWFAAAERTSQFGTVKNVLFTSLAETVNCLAHFYTKKPEPTARDCIQLKYDSLRVLRVNFPNNTLEEPLASRDDAEIMEMCSMLYLAVRGKVTMNDAAYSFSRKKDADAAPQVSP